MKLKDKNRTPIGGYTYEVPETGRTLATDGNFDKLVSLVTSDYIANGYKPPEQLRQLIEDQICTRQPAGRCYYTKGVGDRVSQAIHVGASLVDKVLGTKLEEKARGCGGCSRRRVSMNVS